MFWRNNNMYVESTLTLNDNDTAKEIMLMNDTQRNKHHEIRITY